jgi:hypothetical protein
MLAGSAHHRIGEEIAGDMLRAGLERGLGELSKTCLALITTTECR